MNTSFREHYVYIGTILIGWLIFIFPSILEVNWFYLDTPTTFTVGQSLFQDFSWLSPYNGSGRYFPGYWLYHGIVYKLVGSNLFGNYFIQSVLVLFSACLIYVIVRKLNKNKFAAAAAALLFLTGSPVAENVFTLGKAEIIILPIMLLVVLSVNALQTTHNYSIKNFYVILFIPILIALAIWTKETATTILIFLLTCVIFNIILKHKWNLTHKLVFSKFNLALLLGLVGLAITRLPYFISRKINDSSFYTSYPIDSNLIVGNVDFYLKQNPDVILIGLLATFLTMIKLINFKKDATLDWSNIIQVIGLLALAWSYIVGLLIWRWPLGYYLYVPSAIFSLVFFIVAADFFTRTVDKNRANSKNLLIITIILLILARSYSLPYYYYIATSQKSIDKMYSNAIATYVNIAQGGEKLFVEQWAYFHEPVVQTNLLINKIFMKDLLKVEGMADIFNPLIVTPQVLQLYDVQDSPDATNRFPRKNDYVLVFTGYKPAHWQVRGVVPFINSDSQLEKMGMPLEPIGMNKSEHTVVYFDWKTKRPKLEKTFLGYKLYKVQDGNLSYWQGRYTDGWIGKSAKYNLISNAEIKNINLEIQAFSQNVPNNIKIFNSGELLKEIKIIEPGITTISIENNFEEIQLELEFNIKNTFIPKEKGINDDTRELGVIINVAD